MVISGWLILFGLFFYDLYFILVENFLILLKIILILPFVNLLTSCEKVNWASEKEEKLSFE